jgi:hypothetical protein
LLNDEETAATQVAVSFHPVRVFSPGKEKARERRGNAIEGATLIARFAVGFSTPTRTQKLLKPLVVGILLKGRRASFDFKVLSMSTRVVSAAVGGDIRHITAKRQPNRG